MTFPTIHTCTQLMDFIQEVGFLPLFDGGVAGFSAEDIVNENCHYVTYADGGWEWPLWKWKGQVVTESDCVYGKVFDKKAGFIARQWWPDFSNYRRSKYPKPADDTIEGTILEVLKMGGPQITRELRNACGFNGKGMRSKFDGYVTRLQMGTYIVTEDFVYPRDKHNQEYGWGWSLLNTPEVLYGDDACQCDHTDQESFERIYAHLRHLLPEATEKQLLRLIG